MKLAELLLTQEAVLDDYYLLADHLAQGLNGDMLQSVILASY